jgi:hypothetical protein
LHLSNLPRNTAPESFASVKSHSWKSWPRLVESVCPRNAHRRTWQIPYCPNPSVKEPLRSVSQILIPLTNWDNTRPRKSRCPFARFGKGGLPLPISECMPRIDWPRVQRFRGRQSGTGPILAKWATHFVHRTAPVRIETIRPRNFVRSCRHFDRRPGGKSAASFARAVLEPLVADRAIFR